jgi:hypothetical protein
MKRRPRLGGADVDKFVVVVADDVRPVVAGDVRPVVVGDVRPIAVDDVRSVVAGDGTGITVAVDAFLSLVPKLVQPV